LEAMAEEYGLGDQIVFNGPCYGEENLAPLLMLSDLCVAPGEVGLTAMHVLAYGTPVITHDNPEKQMPEFESIIPGKSGLFFSEGDVDDLAAKIRDWLETNPDRNVVRNACYAVIDKYYNPHTQLDILNAAVMGKSASELPLGESPYVVL
jgi:glycosyltransferase involved in cell wall biosynthesis